MIWEWLAVLTANDGTCTYCHQVSQTMDHVIPFADGGADELKNLVPVCHECNWSKGGKTPPAWYVGLDLRIRWSGDGTPQDGAGFRNSGLRELYLSVHEEVMEMLDHLDKLAAEIADPKRVEWFTGRYKYLGYPSARYGVPWARGIFEGRIAEAKEQDYADPVMGHDEAMALTKSTQGLVDAFFSSSRGAR
ncbi:HNH endonuclease [Streptomyces sp. BE230]|uniref:HNH endonuclease n=1 Tax=Streptomyces sp. BE230 TaxID=3002526 RepID=UPI002ECFBB50|nr:HNH endonuclease signature motif containing protein [Streptomyces sp. BE230]